MEISSLKGIKPILLAPSVSPFPFASIIAIRKITNSTLAFCNGRNNPREEKGITQDHTQPRLYSVFCF